MADWGFRRLGELEEKWPRDQAGEPEEPVFLEHLGGSELDVEMEVNLLDAFGIPVVLQYPNNGDFGKLILGFSGTGVELYVPRSMLEDAQNIISGDMQDLELSDEGV